MLMQGFEVVAIVGSTDTLPGYHHQVKTHQQVLVNSKTLADHPLDPITIDSTTADLFRDCQTQSRLVKPIGSCQHQKTTIDGA
jgi:hypothetical protein